LAVWDLIAANAKDIHLKDVLCYMSGLEFHSPLRMRMAFLEHAEKHN
jgi:hypothetical protein